MALGETFRKEAQAGAIPMEHLGFAATTADEKEDVARHNVSAKLLLDKRG